MNFSKSGVSATVGKNGASINISKNGVYGNVNPNIAGVKGTGMSYRKKILSFTKDKPKEENKLVSINPNIEDAIDALKELGYKEKEINLIKPKLYELEFDNSTDYLKEALKLLKQ